VQAEHEGGAVVARVPEIKGTVVRDSVAWIGTRIGEKRLHRLGATESAAVRALCTEAINISGWYSLDAFAALLDAHIRELDGGDPRPFISQAEKVIEGQLGGIYRAFIRLGSPESLVRRIAAVHATYFRGVDIEVVTCTRGRAVIRYLGFGARHRVMEHAIGSFFRKGLQLSGARDVSVRFTIPIALGIGTADVEMTWA
jgi:hypothetical protein